MILELILRKKAEFIWTSLPNCCVSNIKGSNLHFDSAPSAHLTAYEILAFVFERYIDT